MHGKSHTIFHSIGKNDRKDIAIAGKQIGSANFFQYVAANHPEQQRSNFFTVFRFDGTKVINASHGNMNSTVDGRLQYFGVMLFKSLGRENLLSAVDLGKEMGLFQISKSVIATLTLPNIMPVAIQKSCLDAPYKGTRAATSLSPPKSAQATLAMTIS